MRNLVRKLFLIPAIVIGLVRATRSSRGRAPKRSVELEDVIGPVSKRSLKRWAIEVVVILAIMGTLGFLVAASGVVPIKASSGHWPVTRWFLEFSMARSVSFHARGIEVPSGLDDPSMIQRGAGHYDTGCRPCHGSPELHQPRITAALTPAPPYLGETIHLWKPEELFYIVKHGIKMTGMPAWPAVDRDDEVWAMVAFLLVLPELDPSMYEAVVSGTSIIPHGGTPLEDLAQRGDVPREVIRNCARCHGIDGLGRGRGAFPKLAGQKPHYLLNQLRAYANRDRQSGIMEPVAAGLDEETMVALARYYGKLPEGPDSHRTAGADTDRGREIALRGIPARKIPSCIDCHTHDSKSAYPILHGQYPGYLEQQLELFSKKKRGGSQYASLMREFAHKLEKEEMRDVAAWFASERLHVRSDTPRPSSATSAPPD